MTKLNIELARRCKEIRQAAGISVREWAYELALKPEQINYFEKGVCEIPTLVLVEYAKLKKENEYRR